jgi:hypothetical protein
MANLANAAKKLGALAVLAKIAIANLAASERTRARQADSGYLIVRPSLEAGVWACLIGSCVLVALPSVKP